MAKAIHIGVNNVNRKVSNIFIGVNGIARKVKAGYIGVNGIARQFYGYAWKRYTIESYSGQVVYNTSGSFQLQHTGLTGNYMVSFCSSFSVTGYGDGYVQIGSVSGLSDHYPACPSYNIFASGGKIPLPGRYSAVYYMTSYSITGSRNPRYITCYYSQYYTGKTYNTQGTYIDTVFSGNINDYPENGEQDGYWYVLQF